MLLRCIYLASLTCHVGLVVPKVDFSVSEGFFFHYDSHLVPSVSWPTHIGILNVINILGKVVRLIIDTSAHLLSNIVKPKLGVYKLPFYLRVEFDI